MKLRHARKRRTPHFILRVRTGATCQRVHAAIVAALDGIARAILFAAYSPARVTYPGTVRMVAITLPLVP